MNVYDVSHVSGDIHEIEAEFFQRDGEDWVFFAGDVEVFRLPFLDVLSVSKSSIRPAPLEEPAEQVWL